MHLTTPELFAKAYRDDRGHPLWARTLCGRAEVVRKMTLRREHVTCPACDLAADAPPVQPNAEVPEPPVTSWRRAAEVLGIHEDTLRKHRKRHGDRTKEPWWASEADVQAWYRRLTQPTNHPSSRSTANPRPSAQRARGGTSLSDLRARSKRRD